MAAQFFDADLQGSTISAAFAHGAEFRGSNLDGSILRATNLQGTSFEDTSTTATYFSDPLLWRSAPGNCQTAQIVTPSFEPVIYKVFGTLEATDENIKNTIEEYSKDIPEYDGARSDFRRTLLDRAKSDSIYKEIEKQQAWKACADKALEAERYQKLLAERLVTLACADSTDQPYVLEGIAKQRIADGAGFSTLKKLLSLSILDEKRCPAGKNLDAVTRGELKSAAASAD